MVVSSACSSCGVIGETSEPVSGCACMTPRSIGRYFPCARSPCTRFIPNLRVRSSGAVIILLSDSTRSPTGLPPSIVCSSPTGLFSYIICSRRVSMNVCSIIISRVAIRMLSGSSAITSSARALPSRRTSGSVLQDVPALFLCKPPVRFSYLIS